LLAAEAKDAPGLTINIGPGNPISILELSKLVGKVLGCHLRVKYATERCEDVHAMKADPDLAARILGFVPDMPLEDGLRKTADWFRSVYTVGRETSSSSQAVKCE
jgi:nucleoside-diphosphate-sugar epimerase